MKAHFYLIAFIFCSGLATADDAPVPWLKERLEWFQDQKFGFMMHFGAYSQWGCIESWPLVEVDKWARPDDLPAWVERGKDIERFKRDYWALPKTFNPVKFDPRKWADAAKAAGMKYVVFTTKHHDGFSMFDTKLTDYRITAPDVPFHTSPRANVVREVFNAFRKQGFGIGAYFSKADWHSPYYWSPDAPAPTRNPNYDTLAEPDKWRKFVEFTYGQIEELMTGYGPIDILWLDAGQVRPPQQDIQMDKLVAMARSHQSRLIVVDRTVGGRYENYRTPEQEVPEKPLPYVWESCLTMGDQWSFKPDDKYKSTHKLIHLLVDIVGKGGNFLLNVGPQPDGELPAAAVQRMKEIGDWMKVNGEAIYGTRPIAPYKEGQIVFTRKGQTVYAIYLTQNEGDGLPDKVSFSALQPRGPIRLLGVRKPLSAQTDANGQTTIEIPAAIRKTPSCRHAFVFKFELAEPKRTLTLERKDNWLIIHGPQLPGGELRINYLEAYCRAGSTDADWVKHTVIPHKTETISISPNNKVLKLKCTLADGATVDHTITASDDEVDFRLVAHNPGPNRSEAHWAQACPRLGPFTGFLDNGPDINDYLGKCFIFLNGKLTRMPTPQWATQARYTPGQVWCPANVSRTDVNPRPLSPLVPSNGLIGCFSGDEKMIFATAWEPYQELFQGVARCLHADFRLGGLQPGETKQIHGKVYLLPADVPALLKRYAADFHK